MSDPNAQALFRLRVRYVKQGRLAYLGHLEVLQTIERIVRRAGLPFAVTQGFSPHMRLGVTSALPVGTSSICEWYDLFLTELVPAPLAFERLKAASPTDLAPTLCAYIDVKAPALTAQITRNGYGIDLTPRTDFDVTAHSVSVAIRELMDAQVIEYERGRKHKTLDLASTLVSFEARDIPGHGVRLELDTRISNDGALRPEILLAALDRKLVGGTYAASPIVSTGVQDLISLERYAVCRISQHGEDENATLLPVLEVADVSSRPVTATSVPYL